MKILLIKLLFILPLSALCDAIDEPLDHKTTGTDENSHKTSGSHQLLEQQAKQKTAKFAGLLKQQLVGAIQVKGPSHAIDVCKIQAPKIAAQLSTDGWEVARTSLKTRNPNNKPDDWERKMLLAFDAAYKDKKTEDGLTAIDITAGSFRFMKAIPTGQICLTCHGQEIDSDLLKTIQRHYPLDTATGFTLDDIRGAFTLRKKL